MELNNLKPAKGSTHHDKRIGRGAGSGHGGTATRGHKGAQSRSGYSRKLGFEGGQMPLQRRVPKFGFTNLKRVEFKAINLSTLEELAAKKSGVTGENLLSLLERRLDNVVYRIGLADSRKEARQLVTHGHFRLNGKKVTIPSLIVRAGDVITLREESRSSEKFKNLIEALDTRITPKWIELDKAQVVAKVAALPARDDVDFPFEEHLIVELYSK